MNTVNNLNAAPPSKRKSKRAPKNPLLISEKAQTIKKREIVLEFFHPAARQIFVSGSFNDWRPHEISMTNCGDGEWSVALMLFPGKYEYRFVADGNWLNDPNASTSVSNNFGSQNSVLVVD